MKNIPELPGCGHMGADFLRIYTSHGHSMKTKNCQPCHLELSAQLDVIERMPSKYAAYALAVSSACDSIQLGANATLRALNAMADICNSGDFEGGWPVWCENNFPDIAVAAALTLPTDDALVKRAKECHRPTMRIPAAPGISAAAKELIEETLDDAQWTTMQGKRWAQLVQFICPDGGVENMRIRGTSYEGKREQKQMIAEQVGRSASRLNASVVLVFSDVYLSADPKVRPSQAADRTEAIVVGVQATPPSPCTLGTHPYTRHPAGTVTFGRFEWGKPRSDISLCNLL
jgi:hypothetical protein